MSDAQAEPRIPPAPRLSIASTTVASVATDAILAVASIVVIPYLVGRLGAERYGIFALISVLAGQLVGLHLGLGWAATRRVAETRARDGKRSEGATLYAVLGLAAAASVLVAAAFAALASLAWRRMFHGSTEVLDLAIATVPAGVVIAAAQPALQGLHGILYGQERFFAVVGVRLAHGLARLGVAVAAVAAGGGVLATLWSQAVVDLLVIVAIALFLLVSTSGPREPRRMLHEMRVIVAMGIPFAVAGVFAALLADGEKLAIGIARSIEDFTYYSVPFNVALRLGVGGIALAMVLAPRLSSLRAGGDLPGAIDLAQRAVRVSVGGMSLVLAPLIAIVPELLRLWLGPEFAARSTLSTRILVVALLPRTLAYITESVLRAHARPVAFTMLYAAELPLHLAGVFVLVRAWGLRGAALAWALRVCLDAAAQWVMARRALEAPLGGVLETVGPPLLLALFAAACQAVDGLVGPWLRLAIAAAIGGGIALRLLSPADWGIFKRLLWPGPASPARS